jgi:CheY-like chemotaxis protein
MPKRVLIIDDEENIREMTRLALEATGYEVGEAESGLAAFAIIALMTHGMQSCWIKKCREWSGPKFFVDSR